MIAVGKNCRGLGMTALAFFSSWKVIMGLWIFTELSPLLERLFKFGWYRMEKGAEATAGKIPPLIAQLNDDLRETLKNGVAGLGQLLGKLAAGLAMPNLGAAIASGAASIGDGLGRVLAPLGKYLWVALALFFFLMRR